MDEKQFAFEFRSAVASDPIDELAYSLYTKGVSESELYRLMSPLSDMSSIHKIKLQNCLRNYIRKPKVL